MNTVVETSSFTRHLKTVMIFLSILMGRLSERMENVGDLFFHLFLYHGKAGYIDFEADEHEVDGYVRYRAKNDDGKVDLYSMGFRISNRWMVRRGHKPSARLLWEVKTIAAIDWGVNVHSVVWGKYNWSRQAIAPFDLSRLPSDEVIEQNHAAARKVKDWFAKYFPAKEMASGLTQRDAAMSIIKRY